MLSENALILEACSDSMISKQAGNHCRSDGGKRSCSVLFVAMESLGGMGEAFADERGKMGNGVESLLTLCRKGVGNHLQRISNNEQR